MQRWRRGAVVLVGFLLLATFGYTQAERLIEKLVIPGPLVGGHSKFEGQCEKCHEPFSQTTQSRLCLDCHKEIAGDRLARTRFHGRQTDALNRECKACHTEHKGRNADIMQLDRERFDHDLASYRLIDAHRTVECNFCHVSQTPFHKTSSLCVDCHRKVDAHKSRLGDRCDNCHSPTSWRNVKAFDHGKTKFPLQGAHKDVACAICHIGEIYKNLAQTCVSCHRLQDPHTGQLGDRCEQCHNDVDWRKNINFDHNRTRFQLIGEHASVVCEDCHGSPSYKDAPLACEKCHRDSYHQGRLGVIAQCGSCHNPFAWNKWKFDHARQTSYPLTGAHQRLKCESCHSTKNVATLKLPVSCESCHKDNHQGRLGAQPKCASCHDTSAWSHWRFDHARQAGYPLVGAHARLKCESCHSEKNAASLKIASDCASCHRKDDSHGGSFGLSCERCHNPVSWRRVDIRN